MIGQPSANRFWWTIVRSPVRLPSVALLAFCLGGCANQGADSAEPPGAIMAPPSSPGSPTSGSPSLVATCDASLALAFVALRPTDGVVDAARRAARADRVRVIAHDGAATMDFGPDRLTITLAQDGRIRRLDCN
jgi:hypothetical protein